MTYEHIPGRYGITIDKTNDGTATRVPLRPDLAAVDGSLRTAAVLMAIDMGAALAACLALLAGGMDPTAAYLVREGDGLRRVREVLDPGQLVARRQQRRPGPASPAALAGERARAAQPTPLRHCLL